MEAAGARGRAPAVLEGRVPVAVVGGALLRVHQHLVGLAEFLESLFGLVIAGILVRMKLDRKFAVGSLDFLFGGLAANFQDFVIVALGGHSPAAPLETMTLAGRRRRSLSM